MMTESKKILIVGGGLAGLTAAIHLSKIGLKVTLIEKNEFPKHKVCGEYVSNEVLPYLNWLGIDCDDFNPTHLNKFQFSSVDGKILESELPLGGFGVSRYVLDEFLYQKAIENGCEMIQDTVETIVFSENQFTIITAQKAIFTSEILIGAYGKRSNIDQELDRSFIRNKAPWLAVKAHYSGVFPDNLVGLYHFKGGYCGVSKVEDNKINICYLADYKTFKQYKNIEEYQKNVVSKNPYLKSILDNCEPLFEKPLTISQISFEAKKAVENHILMIGDSAGLIHPLCGNGMAMAIRSAKIASELIEQYYNYEISSRSELEKMYQKAWNQNFKRRLKIGRLLGSIFQKPKLTFVLLRIITVFPFLLTTIIKNTHGKSIDMNTK